MSDGTKIEWTDATWNVINGCSLESPGCTNCYAMRLAGTRLRNHPSRAGLTQDSKAGPVWTGEVRFNDKVLLDPIRWRRPRRIFVCAHGDLFHPNVPDEWIDTVFAVMALAPQHQFQVLTKRAERMRDYFAGIQDGDSRLVGDGWRDALVEGAAQAQYAELHPGDDPSMWLAVHLPLLNVWLGVSVEDQVRADERIPHLLDTPAAVRWLSCEPLLGPLDLTKWMQLVHHHPDNQDRNSSAMQALIRAARNQMGGGIDWVVAGGESGPGARPAHPNWFRQLRDQCEAAGVAFLFKQHGDWVALSNPGDGFWPTNAEGCRRLTAAGDYGDEGLPIQRVGKKSAGRQLDGVEHNGFPAELAA